MRVMFALGIFISLTLLSSCAPPTIAEAGTPIQLSKQSADNLVKLAFASDSPSEKLIIAAYTEKNYPSKGQGKWAAGYLTQEDGRNDEAIKLYKEAVAFSPKDPIYLFSLARLQSPKERLATYGRILSSNPGSLNGGAVLESFRTLRDDLRDKPSATALLATWDRKLPTHFIVPFARGLNAEDVLKDNRAAEKFYQLAVSRKPDSFEPYRRLVDLRINKLMDASTPQEDRVKPLELVQAYIQSHPTSSEAWQYLGSVYEEVIGDTWTALSAYEQAFKAHPNAEALYSAYYSGSTFYMDRVLALMDSAKKLLPNNYAVTLRLADWEAFNDRIPGAISLYEKAFNEAPTPKEQITIQTRLARNVYDAHFQYEEGMKIYDALLAKGSHQDLVLRMKAANRREARDFEGSISALRDLKEYCAAKGINLDQGETEDLLLRAESYLSKQRGSTAYFSKSLLGELKAKFGTVYPSESFDSNSADLKPGVSADLKIIGEMFVKHGISDFRLTVRGHADPGESDPATLSQKRAEAVATELGKNGVPASAVVVQGKADKLPQAVSSNDQGRLANRRVEIVATLVDSQKGRAARPVIVNGMSFSTSPDGEYAALGNSPIQLWDLAKGVRVHDFGLGYFPSFSPNGHYVAAGNYGVGETGELTIWDVFSGQIVVQLSTPGQVLETSWSPDSKQLAYSSRSSIQILDIESKRQTFSRTLGSTNYIGAISWDPLGRWIATSARASQTVFVLDPADLHTVKELSDADWPHSMATTPDGKYLVCVDNRSKLVAWDTSNWIAKSESVSVLSNHLLSVPGSHKMILNDFGNPRTHRAVVYDVDAMKEVASTDQVVPNAMFGFSADRTKILTGKQNRYTFLDAKTLQVLEEVKGNTVRGYQVYPIKETGLAITRDQMSLKLWDVKTATKLASWPGTFYNVLFLPNDSTKFLTWTVDEKAAMSEVSEGDTKTLKLRSLVRVNYRVDQVVPNANNFGIGGVPFLPRDIGSKSASASVYTYAGKKLSTVTFPTNTVYLKYGSLHKADVHTLDVSGDGSMILVGTSWQDGLSRGEEQSTFSRLFSTQTGALIRKFEVGEAFGYAYFGDASAKKVVMRTIDREKSFDTATGKLVSDRPQPLVSGHEVNNGLTVTFDPQHVKLLNNKGERVVVREFSNITSIAVFPKLNVVVTMNLQNEIHFLSLTNLETINSIAID